MVHGGAWMVGDKSMGRVVTNKAAYWLPKGYIFISINNPLLPAAGPLGVFAGRVGVDLTIWLLFHCFETEDLERRDR
jgi:hypothetical protein